MTNRVPRSEKQLHEALGCLVHEWSWLEASVGGLLYDLAAIHSDCFYKVDGAGLVFTTMLTNSNMKSNIANIRALSYEAAEPSDLFERLSPLLNEISNELRNKRNRFVHDRWLVLSSQRIIRIQDGTSILRAPGSGERTLTYHQQEEFASIEEIRATAVRVHNIRMLINEVQDELQEIHSLTWRVSEPQK